MSWTMEYIAPKEKMTATRQIDAPMGTARDILDCFWRTDRGSESELDNGPFIEGDGSKNSAELDQKDDTWNGKEEAFFSMEEEMRLNRWWRYAKTPLMEIKAWSSWRYPNRWTSSLSFIIKEPPQYGKEMTLKNGVFISNHFVEMNDWITLDGEKAVLHEKVVERVKRR